MIYIVGTGPGKISGMTLEAKAALDASQIIVGYKVYVDLLKADFPDKEFAWTGMGKEIERCKLCFDYALEGKNVSLVCSGDAGVYGMAEPLFRLQKENSVYREVEITVIPGVTAALSGAALLGAPLNHDFCVISLSDLLTPWEIIERRLRAAVQGDFALAVYNPQSHHRKDYLDKACKILIEEGAAPDRACGFVKNIGREGQDAAFCRLSELASQDIDMFTTVFIGNSQSDFFESDKGIKLLTKRGYKL